MTANYVEINLIWLMVITDLQFATRFKTFRAAYISSNFVTNQSIYQSFIGVWQADGEIKQQIIYADS